MMSVRKGSAPIGAILAVMFLCSCGSGNKSSSSGDITQDGSADQVGADIAGDLLDGHVPPADAMGELSTDQVQGDTRVGDLGDVDTDVQDPPQDWHLQAIASCEPGTIACDKSLSDQPAGTYRSDFFYPFEKYPELGNKTIEGGRIQIAAVSKTSGAVTKVELNGTDVTHLAFPEVLANVETPEDVLALTVPGTYHWVHVWPFVLQSDQPFFLAFHVGTLALEGASEVTVKITTEAGLALEGQVPIAKPLVPLTFVTTSADLGTVIVHARNEDVVPHTLTALEVQGRDVTSFACIPKTLLGAGESVMWTIPLCKALQLGEAWTVVARFQDAPASVGVGRVIMPHYPIHSWVSESDCPYPTANWENYLAHRAKGFDTPFLRGSFNKEGCNNATSEGIIAASVSIPDQFFLLDEWANPGTTDYSHVARLLGDEVDSDVEDKPWRVSRDAKRSWTEHPGMTTYIGAARHRPNGTFSGIADIQGMDIYFASCAPTILSQTLPGLRAPYDYFRAVQQNQRPGPTWFYSQGLASGWIGNPNATELKVSAMSVVAAAAKGLMYFMTPMEQVAKFPGTWEAMGEVNRVIRGIRQFLREGEATGGASATAQGILVEAIRSADAIVIPVVNVTAQTELDYSRCLFEEDAHWILADVLTDVSVLVPDDFAVADLIEVVDGQVLSPSEAISAQGRTLRIEAVALSDATPYRVFVLIRSSEVAGRIEAAMQIPEVSNPALP